MKKLAIAAAAVLAMAGAQAAVTPLQTGTTGTRVTDLNAVNVGSAFNLFNSSLGTLTGVSLLWNWTATSTASLQNTSAQAQTFSWISTLQFFLDDVSPLVAETATATLFNVPRGPLAAGATLNLGTNTVSSAGNLAVPIGSLAAFIGTGTSQLTCSTATGSNFSGGGGNIVVNQQTNAACGFQIQYTYTPAVVVPTIPEPSSLALVGLALAGAGFVARRRKA